MLSDSYDFVNETARTTEEVKKNNIKNILFESKTMEKKNKDINTSYISNELLSKFNKAVHKENECKFTFTFKEPVIVNGKSYLHVTYSSLDCRLDGQSLF